MSVPRVLKFPIQPGGTKIGEGTLCTPLSCGYQDGEVVVWAEVDDTDWSALFPRMSNPDGAHVLAVATGTGRPPGAWAFLGTVQGVEGDLVFHLYWTALRKLVDA